MYPKSVRSYTNQLSGKYGCKIGTLSLTGWNVAASLCSHPSIPLGFVFKTATSTS